MPPVVIKDDRVAEVRFPSSQFEVELKDGRISLDAAIVVSAPCSRDAGATSAIGN